MKFPIRINKYLRDKGVASRREVDSIIDEGKVFINGKKALKGDLVERSDRVDVKGYQKDYIYIAYYKPRGVPTQDLPGKKSVVSVFKKRGLYPIGRLDKDSEGLLLLTNDGRITSKILSDKKKFEKEYIVKVREKIKEDVVQVFEKGMKTETFGKLLPVKTEIIDNHNLKMILHQGKKHQIRVMLSEMSYTVLSLKRVRIGGITLEEMFPGEEKNITLKSLGIDKFS